MKIQESEDGSQNTFAAVDLETGTAPQGLDTKKTPRVISPELSSYFYSIGVGFFCSMFYLNILAAPMLLSEKHHVKVTIKTYILKTFFFVSAFLISSFFFSQSIAGFLFLCFAYVPFFSNL